MSLLGEDGLGYELARKLESCGVWRSWLGDSTYTNFAHFLLSPSTWETLMTTTTNDSSPSTKTRAQIHLQLRVRALLFDKASVSLFLRSPPNSSSSSVASTSTSSKINPSYLQLHGDDVYFSLEDFNYCSQDQEGSAPSNSTHSKVQPKLGFSSGLKYGEPEGDESNRSVRDGFPETWYNQFIEKYRVSRQHKILSGDREPHKRTSEGMSAYLKLLERHKRSRQAFKDDQCMSFDNPIWENGSNMHQTSVSDFNSSSDDETYFFPEIMFPSNSVPDSALPPIDRLEEDPKVECYGVLDSLPHVMTRSPAMLERFGIRPEYLRIGLERSKYRGKNGLEGNGKSLGQEQALQMSQKVIARVLTNVGFEGATEVPIEVLSQFLSGHICKLGRILKTLTDNYRKQCSAIEVLKMFLQTVGYGNLGTLVDHVKDGIRNQQQYGRGIQPVLQSQHQNLNFQSQQILRQMNPQMPMVHPQAQNIAFQQQQQWDRMKRRQSSAPRPAMSLEKERPIVEVKLENMPESLMDANAFAQSNNRHPQMQFRQQQTAALANLHAQPSHQFKQLSPMQGHQFQTQSPVTMRAQPVKVEGFSELMGGDMSMKHDSEENKLTSPSK